MLCQGHGHHFSQPRTQKKDQIVQRLQADEGPRKNNHLLVLKRIVQEVCR